jgi:hypothetical protein
MHGLTHGINLDDDMMVMVEARTRVVGIGDIGDGSNISI